MRTSLYYFDLIKEELSKPDEKTIQIAQQLQSQTMTQLGGLIDFLKTAHNSVQKRQTLAKVKWKAIEPKKILFKLEPTSGIIQISYDTTYQIVDWDSSDTFDEDVLGLDIKPYHLDIIPDESGSSHFKPKDLDNERIIQDILKSDKPFVRLEGKQYKISIVDSPDIPNIIYGPHQESFEVIAPIEKIGPDIHIKVRPKPDKNKIKWISLKKGGKHIRSNVIEKSFRIDDRFYMKNGVELLIERIDDMFQPSNVDNFDEELLVGSDGTEYKVIRQSKEKKKKGYEIELLQPEGQNYDLTIDPRHNFFNQDVGEIWLSEFVSYKEKENKIKIFSRDRDTFHLWIKRLPENGNKIIYLPKNTNNIDNQRKAAEMLAHHPLRHHRNLLRLFENPDRTNYRWPKYNTSTEETIDDWCFLTEPKYDGTDAEREFVQIAINTPDYAFLEGPPGSGKTTAIAELVYQLAKRNKKVLLLSNTHYAVDNVLERIITNSKAEDIISPMRVSRVKDKVDDFVERYYLDSIIDTITSTSGVPRNIAEKIAISSTNLVCGTTTGLRAHPDLSLDINLWNRNAPATPCQPLFDYLIIDESSKSTFQEFLYPALFAKKWVLVGDVKQLSPQTEEQDLEANVENIPQFDLEYQKALLVLFRLVFRRIRAEEQWLVVDQTKVIKYLFQEILARKQKNHESRNQSQNPNQPKALNYPLDNLVVAILNDHSYDQDDLYEMKELGIAIIRPDEFSDGRKTALLSAANLVIIPKDIAIRIQNKLPPQLMLLCSDTKELDLYKRRHTSWLIKNGGKRRLQTHYYMKDVGRIDTYFDLEVEINRYFERESWGHEWVWRVKRINELKMSGETKLKQDYYKFVELLEPTQLDESDEKINSINASLADVKSIAFPSILESLQYGIQVNRKTPRTSYLSKGLTGHDQITEGIWKSRHILLKFQHRMEEKISAIPHECFYNRDALYAANTIIGRKENWGYPIEEKDMPTYGWIDVSGEVNKGVNQKEIQEIEEFLKRLEKKFKNSHPNREGSDYWEVAVLTFYLAQENAIIRMLQEWTKNEHAKTRFRKGNMKILVGTIDRFQGREADIVLLSLRNIDRLGFLDSMNRMNVALTRARLMMVFIGKREFYLGKVKDHEVEEWKKAAERATPIKR